MDVDVDVLVYATIDEIAVRLNHKMLHLFLLPGIFPSGFLVGLPALT